MMDAKKLEQFQVLYSEYIDSVYNYMYYRSGRNSAIAEDLTSEIFLKAAENFESFDQEKGTFKSWIFRISHNHLVNYYRDAKQENTIEDFINVLEHPHSLTEHLHIKEENQALIQALEKLPDEARTLVHLRYFEELSYEEIADVVGKPAGSLRTNLHRILKLLHKELNFNFQ